MGKVTYSLSVELMIDYWPTAEANPSAPAFEVEFAHIWNDKPKIVFSRTPDKVEWNSRLARGNIAEEIKKLKEQSGKDLGLGRPTAVARAWR